MSEFIRWVEGFSELSVVMKIAVPVALVLLIALYAFFLWAAGRIAGQEDFNYPRALAVSAIEFVVMLGISYGLLSAIGGDSLLSLAELKTQGTFNAIYHLIDIGLLIGLLAVLAKIAPLRGALIWAARFVLLVHLGWFITGTTFIAMAMYLGVQAPGAYGGAAFFFNLTMGVLFLIAALSGLVLWMAGALANAEKLTFLRSLLLAWVKNGLLIGLFFLGASPLASALPNLEPLQRLFVMGGILLGVNLVLVVLGSMLLGGTSIGRGILVWVFEIPLWALMGGLVIGIDMVALSIVQTAQTPSGAKVLELVVLGLQGAVVIALLIFFGGQLLTPAVGAPRRSAA